MIVTLLVFFISKFLNAGILDGCKTRIDCQPTLKILSFFFIFLLVCAWFG